MDRMLLLTMKNVLVCDSELRANEARNHDVQDVLEPQAKTKAKLTPKRGQKPESTQSLLDLEEEVTSTVPVVSGSAPIRGASSSSTDVLVNSSVAASVIVARNRCKGS